MTPGAAEPDARLERALLSLDGLSTGDAFGERFFLAPERARDAIRQRRVAPPPWPFTDDTAMAISIVDVLARAGAIDQDELAATFVRRYGAEPWRGYGRGTHELFAKVVAGEPWREAAPSLFGGAGSMGNGAAMRVAPVGAYFADDLEAAVREARASAEVTHAHREGAAGAVAVAAAAALAWRRGPRPGRDFLDEVVAHVPPGETRLGIEAARALPLDAAPEIAAAHLGSGGRVTAQDTVPFCLWCAARHLDDYAAALWTTVAGLGDRDTTCAIVGGIVALSAGRGSLPAAWLAAREPLPR